MIRILLSLGPLLSLLLAPTSWATDACSTRAVLTSAAVSVSDGTSFETRSFFHSREAAAIQHISDDEQIVAVEGPVGWARRGSTEKAGSDFYPQFALGHQYHALLLYFDDIAANSRRDGEIQVRGKTYVTTRGDYPHGGTVHLIDGATNAGPAGLIFELPEAAPITALFSDWREIDGLNLPYQVKIDDGAGIFDYQYTDISVSPKSPLWFFDVVRAPDIDQVQVYRLHRKMLAAHCLGDAGLIAELSAPEIVVASDGEVQRFSKVALHQQFAALFDRLDYAEYHDISLPIIETSKGSDLGWILVNVRAVGSEKQSDAKFNDQWAWAMLVEKVDGTWLHAGNASNAAGR